MHILEIVVYTVAIFMFLCFVIFFVVLVGMLTELQIKDIKWWYDETFGKDK